METIQDQTIANCLKYSLFSWSKQSGLNPIQANHSDGIYIFDNDGKRYLDFSSQLINVNIGHGNKHVINATTRQLETLQFVSPSIATSPRAQLAKKLAEYAPGDLTKTFFTLGGAEAIENAIKLARVYTGRPKILAFYRSYHGATYGAMSAGGRPEKTCYRFV